MVAVQTRYKPSFAFVAVLAAMVLAVDVISVARVVLFTSVDCLGTSVAPLLGRVITGNSV